MKKREIFIIFRDRQTNKVIEENLFIEFYTTRLEKNITPDKGRYCLKISDNLSEIVIERVKKDEEYFIKKKMHLQINQNTEYFIEILHLNWFTKLIYKYSSALISFLLGGVTIFGGISFVSAEIPIEINIAPKNEINNKLDIDPRDYMNISVNEYAEASYFCDDCSTVIAPGKNISNNPFAPLLTEPELYAVDMPYNYKIELENKALINNIYIYNWEDGEYKAIVLEHDIMKNNIGGYDISCGDGCTLNVALSAEGNSLTKIDLDQSNSEALSENKASLSEIKKSGSGYMGIYYQYAPISEKNQKSYLDPKISKGIIRIGSPDNKSYYYIYVQLKSYNRPVQTDETIPGQSRNKSLIMTEDEFSSKGSLENFLEENSELLEQMQKECSVIEEENQQFGTDSACNNLSDIENYLYDELSANLEEIQSNVKEANKKFSNE